MCSLFVSNLIFRMLCFVRTALKDSCLIRSSHIQNDVERFRNGPVHELCSLKASQMCKAHTSFCVGFRVAIKSSLHVEHWILRYVNLHALFFLLWLVRFQPFGPSWFFHCYWTNNTSELTCDFHDVWARDTYLVKFETIINNAEFRKKIMDIMNAPLNDSTIARFK